MYRYERMDDLYQLYDNYYRHERSIFVHEILPSENIVSGPSGLAVCGRTENRDCVFRGYFSIIFFFFFPPFYARKTRPPETDSAAVQSRAVNNSRRFSGATMYGFFALSIVSSLIAGKSTFRYYYKKNENINKKTILYGRYIINATGISDFYFFFWKYYNAIWFFFFSYAFF